jgi:hypothetical protein
LDQKNDEQWSLDGHLVRGGCKVLDLWQRLGGQKQVSFYRLLNHNPPCQWPNDPRIMLQIHFNSSQWIKKMMNSGPETVIWTVAVMKCWICGQNLGQKQVGCSVVECWICG